MLNPREAAFLALIMAQRGQYLEDFFRRSDLLKKDLSLAYEIAYGVERQKLSLGFLLNWLYEKEKTGCPDKKKKLKLKPKERLLFYTALYQYFFMDKLPFYAIVNETVSLAKKYFHTQKAAFFNALLRLLEKKACSENKNSLLPSGKSVEDISIRYSYPAFFVSKLLLQYGYSKTCSILQQMNFVFPLMARLRNNKNFQSFSSGQKEELELVFAEKLEVVRFLKKDMLTKIANDPDYYIQNVTPVFLIQSLSSGLDFKPEKILDLCAAPGGKLLALKDLFSKSKLFANDLSEPKIKKLQENLQKYQVAAEISCGPAEKFKSLEKYDLIVLDVPCSNSGVLGKRAEARWRLDAKHLKELTEKQFQILQNAVSFLKTGGQIWYMTCSILQEENENMLIRAQKELGLVVKSSFLQLPDQEGRDGGFGASLVLAD